MSMKTLQRWRLFPLGLRQKEVERFFKRANYFHPTIKLTAEISGNQITFLDTIVFKGKRFAKDSILDNKTHFPSNLRTSPRITH